MTKTERDLMNEALHYRQELKRIYNSSICMLSAQIAKEALQYTSTVADDPKTDVNERFDAFTKGDDECRHENKNFIVDGIYCEDCDEVFEDNTGSNLLGG